MTRTRFSGIVNRYFKIRGIDDEIDSLLDTVFVGHGVCG
jgi:hypothetical protein